MRPLGVGERPHVVRLMVDECGGVGVLRQNNPKAIVVRFHALREELPH